VGSEWRLRWTPAEACTTPSYCGRSAKWRIAVSFAAASRRLARAAIPVGGGHPRVTMAAGALQINEYYRLAWRNGGAQNWTDAIFPLSDAMKGVHATEVYFGGWGILDSLRLLDRGRLRQEAIFDAVPPDQGTPDMRASRPRWANPTDVFIAPLPGIRVFSKDGTRKR